MSEASCPNFEPRAHARSTGLTTIPWIHSDSGMADSTGVFCKIVPPFILFHLTRCLRTLRARLQSSHSVTARGVREGPWSGQLYYCEFCHRPKMFLKLIFRIKLCLGTSGFVASQQSIRSKGNVERSRAARQI